MAHKPEIRSGRSEIGFTTETQRGQSRNPIGLTCAKVQSSPSGELCHFDRREKAFSNPLHSLGMRSLAGHFAFF